jgi:hypothetical protein
MDKTAWEKDILKSMGESLAGKGLEARVTFGDGQTQPDMLRSRFAVLGNGEGIIISDVNFLEFDQEPSVIQLFSTIGVNLSDDGITELEKVIARMNLYCPLGTFGIFYGGKQLYHKYCAVMDRDWSTQQAAQRGENLLEMLLNLIASQYELLIDIADGKTTFEKAVAEGRMQA